MRPGHESLSILVADASAVGRARRVAVALAEAIGFDETDKGKVALVVTEAATNLLQHAERGEILLRPLLNPGSPGVEVLALDSGPGMTNVGQCLEDGFSTGGSMGAGLGSIARLASAFDVYSQPGVGTVLLARVRGASGAGSGPSPQRIECGAVCVSVPSEEICGDGWALSGDLPLTSLLVVDGLGHGPEAATAARAALDAFAQHAGKGPAELLECLHEKLRKTRGAAVGIAQIDWVGRTVAFAGIGNVSASVASASSHQSFPSDNGIVGQQARRFKEMVHPWPAGGLLILHSDGVSSRWSLGDYRGLGSKAPGVIAGVLYRDHGRRRDDATVLILRENPLGSHGAPGARP